MTREAAVDPTDPTGIACNPLREDSVFLLTQMCGLKKAAYFIW